MKTKLKFRCDSVTRTVDHVNASLTVVTSGSEENASYFKYTPNGTLNLHVVNLEAGKMFEPGKEFYVEVSEA